MRSRLYVYLAARRTQPTHLLGRTLHWATPPLTRSSTYIAVLARRASSRALHERTFWCRFSAACAADSRPCSTSRQSRVHPLPKSYQPTMHAPKSKLRAIAVSGVRSATSPSHQTDADKATVTGCGTGESTRHSPVRSFRSHADSRASSVPLPHHPTAIPDRRRQGDCCWSGMARLPRHRPRLQ